MLDPSRLGLRARLFVVSIALVAVGLFGAWWYLSRALDAMHEREAVARLEMGASAAAASLRGGASARTDTADPVLRNLAGVLRARLTLVDAAGRVVADSEVDPARVASLPGHGDRPEVRAALRDGRGVAVRRSDTLRRPFVYVAVRADAGHVVRAAMSPDALRDAQQATARLLVVAALLGLVVAAGMSWLAVTMASRPVRDLTRTARAMVKDITVRARLTQDDEVGALAGALDELADGLARSLAGLEGERDRLGAILEAMTEGVLVTRADGRVVLANRAVREIFGVARELVGASPEALRSDDLAEALAAAPRTREVVARELALTGARPRRVAVRVAPLEGPEAGAVAVLSDVTELRRLETVRRDFIANVSHELRTPVAAIRAAVETLLLGAIQQPEAAREFVQILERHAERLHRLVEDLLELSKLESREAALVVAPLDAGEVARHAIELMDLAAQARDADVRAEVAPGLPAVMAERRALEHVLTNLIENAIKYSPEGARVEVRAARHGDGVRVTVRDDGPGIEARHLPRLFERFYRVDTGRSRALGGTGLGLAIVKHLCEAMGAAVSVESAPGQGSSFHVDLRAAGP